jgi:uncharacterized repeat protein (TIGR03803 family)
MTQQLISEISFSVRALREQSLVPARPRSRGQADRGTGSVRYNRCRPALGISDRLARPAACYANAGSIAETVLGPDQVEVAVGPPGERTARLPSRVLLVLQGIFRRLIGRARFGDPPDGNSPSQGEVVFDSSGNLYGTTFYGGMSGDSDGTVYELMPLNGGWSESVIHSFTGFPSGGDGAFPDSGVAFDSAGNLYGTTINGGIFNCDGGGAGCGVVYKLSRPGSGLVGNHCLQVPRGQ